MLVAISIPIFTAQLGKAHLATNQANARAAYAAVTAEMITEDKSSGKATYDVKTAKIIDTTIGDPGTDYSLGLPQDWKYDDKKDTDLCKKTANKWNVNISSAGTVTFQPDYT